MVSATQQTTRRRRITAKRRGRQARHDRARAGTQQFPVHPEGYDQNAADARSKSQAS